jgi:FkbM family methyltransferase
MTDAPEIKQNSNGIWMLEGEQLWDSDILPVCLEHINPGDTVIDAGAWIGGHTMAYAKKVGVNGRVIAFEPNSFAYDCMVLNTNQFQNVERREVALGDKIQPAWISAKRGWYDSGFISEELDGSLVGMFPVDHYDFASNFIKIDVEGCELKVLNGAVKTIEKFKPKMVIEVNAPALQRQGNTPQEVWAWLVEHRYRVDSIEQVTHDAPIYNVIAIPR